MTYAFTQDARTVVYQKVLDRLGDDPPKGMISHVAIERPEGGLRYIDVWESEEDWDRMPAALRRTAPRFFRLRRDR